MGEVEGTDAVNAAMDERARDIFGKLDSVERKVHAIDKEVAGSLANLGARLATLERVTWAIALGTLAIVTTEVLALA